MNAALGTWVDGQPARDLPADDRGLHYADGLFETLLVRRGRPRFLERHLARLLEGCRRLAIRPPDENALRTDIATACAVAPALAIVKVIVTRGSAVKRGYAPGGSEVARRLLWLYATSPLEASLRQGVNLIWAAGRLGDNAALAGIKHLARLENVIASRAAHEAGAFDAVMRGADDRVVCGAMTNLFMVRAGQVLTPPVDRAGVAGVLRGVVLRECATLGIAAAEQALSAGDLASADGVFVTNARIGVVPVRRLGEHDCRMDPLAPRLATHIEALDA